jgi:hypothetical protein
MDNLNNNHVDAAVKGAAIGVLTYVGAQFNVSAEVVALAVPLVAAGLSWISTKIGDKNTALLVDLATKAVKNLPVKEEPKKNVAKKASSVKKKK